MPLSVESVIAIIALFIAVPPTIAILARYYQYRSNHVTDTSQDDLELRAISRDPSIIPSQQPLQIRVLFEESGQRQIFEVTRGQSNKNYGAPEASMPLLENSQVAVPD